MDCSTNTSCVGEACKPLFKAASKSFGSCTKPPPVPPKVNDGRITNGNPVSCAISFPSRNERAVRPLQTPTPISNIFKRNFSRSSVVSMALISTPMMRTPYLAQIPAASQSIAKFKAVWPPIVGKTASTLWFSKMWMIDAFSKGFKYTWSAFIGSVIIVAGFELIKITSMPSSLRERAAWEPE